MTDLPHARQIAAHAADDATARALVEASLDWSHCLIRADFWFHPDWSDELWRQLRRRAEADSSTLGANVIPMDRYRRTS